MFYLANLKEKYKKEITSLENEFKVHCQKLIDKKMKEIIPKLKQEIEDNILNNVSKYFHYSNECNEFDLIDITDIYNSKFHPLFIKYFKYDDGDNVRETIENFIKEFELFENIKKYLEISFHGLMFETFINVELSEIRSHIWEIKKITLLIISK